MQSNQPSLPLTTTNIYKMMVSAVVVAAKYCDDVNYSNIYYAKIAGLQLAEFNQLEMQFLIMVNFEVYVSEHVYEQYRGKLQLYMRKYTIKPTSDSANYWFQYY